MAPLDDEMKFKLLLIDAICGVGIPSIVLAQECQNVGMAALSADGTATWRREALWKIGPETLQELYSGLCEQREENMRATAPLEDAPRIVLAQ